MSIKCKLNSVPRTLSFRHVSWPQISFYSCKLPCHKTMILQSCCPRIAASSILSTPFPIATTLWALRVCKSSVCGNVRIELNKCFIGRLWAQFNHFNSDSYINLWVILTFFRLNHSLLRRNKPQGIQNIHACFPASFPLSALTTWDRPATRHLPSHLGAQRSTLLFLQLWLSSLLGFMVRTDACCES